MVMAADKNTSIVFSMKEMIKSMAENSSIHGVSRWVTSRYWYQRALWVLVFFGATGGMIYQLSLLFHSFQMYPVKTSVDLKFSALPFPAVSLCNMNPIKMSKLSLTSTNTQRVMNGSGLSIPLLSNLGRKKRSLVDRSNLKTDNVVSKPDTRPHSQQDLIHTTVPSRKWHSFPPSKPDLQKRPINIKHKNFGNHHKHFIAPQSWLYTLFASRTKGTKAKNVERQKRSFDLSGLSGLFSLTTEGIGDLNDFVDSLGGSNYKTTTRSPSGDSSSGDDTGSGSYSNTSTVSTSDGSRSHEGRSDYSRDGTWSYYQEYIDELDNYVTDEWTKRVSQFHEEFQKNPSEIRKEVGHAVGDMLISCAFNGHKCYENNFTLFQSLEYGNCYTFQDTSYITKRSGPLQGLRLMLNIETKEYVEDYMDAFGVRLVIHEPGTFPFPEEEGFTINPMYETTIGMRLVSIKRASEPHGKCESGEEFQKMFDIKYTIPACLKLCRQREIISRCNCIPSESYVNVGITDDLQFCSNSSEKSDCEEFLNFKLENNLINCGCRSPCRQMVYDTSLSGRSWPSRKYLKENILRDLCAQENVSWYLKDDCHKFIQNKMILDEANLKRLSESFLKVVIYFEDLNHEEIREEPMYDGFQFVSDIGGALGLFMGASILSFVEVFQFLLEILNLLRSRMFINRKKSVTPVKEMVVCKKTVTPVKEMVVCEKTVDKKDIKGRQGRRLTPI